MALKTKIADNEKRSVESVAQALNAEPKVSVYIPLIEGSGETQIECCLNGYTYVIRRGEHVKLPESIALLLKKSGVI